MFNKIYLAIKSVKNLPILLLDLLGLRHGDLTYHLWNGNSFIVRAGSSDISEVIINNADSEYPSNFFPQNPHSVIVDAGANIGDTTLFIYRKLKEKKPKIYALEPGSSNYNYLLRNIKLNKAEGIVPCKLALTDSDGHKILNFNGNEFDGAFIKGVMSGQNTNSEEVETSTLVSFCKKNNIKKIDLLKMDIEGSEYAVFRSSKQFIRNNVKSIFVELHNLNKRDNYRKFKKHVSELGFEIQADIMNRTLFLINTNSINE